MFPMSSVDAIIWQAVAPVPGAWPGPGSKVRAKANFGGGPSLHVQAKKCGAKAAPECKIATVSGRYAAGKWGKMFKMRISTIKLYGNPKKIADFSAIDV
jgi:hypothetical protein